MKKGISFYKYILILLFPISILITFLSSRYPRITENIYSMGIYKTMVNILSPFSRIPRVSIGEILLYLFLLFILFQCIRFICHALQAKVNFKKALFQLFINIVAYISIIYFIFIITWGINYHRLPFSIIANLYPEPSSIEDLESLCKNLIEEANNLRERILEDEKGVGHIPDKLKNIPKNASIGFSYASKRYPQLKGKYVQPKGVFLSNLMSYAGIAGIFFPFTGEANYNTLIPDVQLPSTICHEIAHQRGFAREDEANYIAYVVCISHPDINFQYSGLLLALSHSMDKLYQHNQEKYYGLITNYSEGVVRDFNDIAKFWNTYGGPIEKISSKMNNWYLRSNFQEEGIHSYGRMVDLLLAEFKKAH